MDSIIRNVVDPSWWFSGLFFTVIGCLLPVLAARGRDWTRTFFRNSQARAQTKIKNSRQDSLLIAVAVIRANAYFSVFLLSTLGLLAAIGTIAAMNQGKVPVVVWLWMAPVLIIELMWLRADDFAKVLVREHKRLQRLRSDRLTSDSDADRLLQSGLV